jgi:hypothetical protein
MADAIAAVANNTAMVSPTQQTEPTNQRPLSEFLADVRANGLNKGASTALANPAALSGEMLKRLHGFVERSNNFEKTLKGLRTMDGKEVQVASFVEEGEGEKVHQGPAREALASVEKEHARTDQNVTIEEIRRLSELMQTMMGFAAHTEFVSTAVTNITGSVRTLTRGQ